MAAFVQCQQMMTTVLSSNKLSPQGHDRFIIHQGALTHYTDHDQVLIHQGTLARFPNCSAGTEVFYQHRCKNPRR